MPARRPSGPEGARDEQLLERGPSLVGELAEVLVRGGDDAPAENIKTLVAGDPFDAGLLTAALRGLQREEGEPGGVFADIGQFEVCDFTQECVWHLGEDARTVSGAGVRADGTSVLEVAQRLKRQRDDVVSCSTPEGGDHGQAAGILFECRVVQTLLRGVSAGGAIGRLEVHLKPSSGNQVTPGTPSARSFSAVGSSLDEEAYRELSSLLGAVLVAVAPTVTSAGGSLTSTKSSRSSCDSTSAPSSLRPRPGMYGLGSTPG